MNAVPVQQNFAATISNWVKKTKKVVDADIRAIEIALFSGIIQATPVDEGRARGNWQTTVGSPADGVVERDDPSGTQALQDMVNNVGGAGQVTWLTNNLPYATVLEYGQYPNPPKRGTRIKGAKLAALPRTSLAGGNPGLRQAYALQTRSLFAPATYEIRSVGGYSKQAPAGMVRINMARIGQIVAAALGSGLTEGGI